MDYTKLSKKARGCMLVAEIISALIISGILFVTWLFAKDSITFCSPNWFFVIIALIWIVCIATPFIRYERYRYRFTDEEIDVKEGIWVIKRNIVPIERLHQITMQSGPIDRLFGLTKVIVTTAGGEVTIRFLQKEKAEEIVEQLKTRINQYAKAEKDGGTE